MKPFDIAMLVTAFFILIITYVVYLLFRVPERFVMNLYGGNKRH